MTDNIHNRAIIIGAGIGGLTAAGAVASYFNEVVILEKDKLSEKAEQRKGIPQGGQIHNLLAGGRQAFEEIFPNFDDDLAAAGGVRLQGGIGFRMDYPNFSLPQRDLGFHSYALSRPMLESVMRNRATNLANTKILSNNRVTAITYCDETQKVSGVELSDENKELSFMAADLVVDASGLGRVTNALLSELQLSVEKEVIGVQFGYSGAVFKIPEGADHDWTAAGVFPDAPNSSRCGIIAPIEGNYWLVGLGGRKGDYPPRDANEYIEYARQMHSSVIYDSIKDAELVGEIKAYRFRESHYNHFASMPDFPRGLIPLGDSVCKMNPIYGQGMAVAAQQSVALRKVFAEVKGDIHRLSPKYFEAINRIIEGPWQMSSVPDFIFDTTTGEKPENIEMILAVIDASAELMVVDEEVQLEVMKVRQLLQHRDVLVDNGIMGRATMKATKKLLSA